MRLIRFINEAYTNWTFPDSKTMKSDFSEYKKKEKRKWQGRAEMLGMRWPLFKDFNHFRDSLKKAEVVKLTRSIDNKISNRSHSHDIDDLKQLVSGYVRPRDVDRIVDGFQSNDRIPYPIVLRTQRGMWIMAGNTRLDASFIMDITPIVLIVDVDNELSEVIDLQRRKRKTPLFKDAPQSDDLPVDVVEKIIKKDCGPYLKTLQSKGIGAFWRGMGYPTPTGNFGKKAVRKDRTSKGMQAKVANVLNDWLQSNGHNRRDKSISATASWAHANFFGEPFAVFPIGKFSYTWVPSNDINEPNNKSKWHPELLYAFFDIQPHYSDSPSARAGLPNFEQFFRTDKGIMAAYNNKYEIWFNCKSYYFVKSGSQMIQSGDLERRLGLKKNR